MLINSKKLPKFAKERILGYKNYDYDKSNQIGYYYLQFDLYEIKCDENYFDIVIKAVDFWDSLNATERYNYCKQFNDFNCVDWRSDASIESGFKRDFCIAVMKLYDFIQPLDTDRFREFVNSDNVVKIQTNLYQTQCTLYRKSFTWSELQNYFIKEYQ